MTHYSVMENMVRVDFFKSSGKWYTTEAVEWIGGWRKDVLIHDAFAKSLRDHFKKSPDRLSTMDAVCLEPYHELECPIQIKNGGWRK